MYVYMPINLPKMKNHYTVLYVNVCVPRMGKGAGGGMTCR